MEYTSPCMLMKSYTCSSMKSVFVVYSLTFNMRTNQVEITCNVLNNKDHYEIIENNEEKWSNTTAMFRQLLSPHLPQVICGRKECRGYLSFALSAASAFTPAYYTVKHCAIQLRWINYLGLEKKINPHNTIYKTSAIFFVIKSKFQNTVVLERVLEIIWVLKWNLIQCHCLKSNKKDNVRKEMTTSNISYIPLGMFFTYISLEKALKPFHEIIN